MLPLKEGRDSNFSLPCNTATQLFLTPPCFTGRCQACLTVGCFYFTPSVIPELELSTNGMSCNNSSSGISLIQFLQCMVHRIVLFFLFLSSLFSFSKRYNTYIHKTPDERFLNSLCSLRNLTRVWHYHFFLLLPPTTRHPMNIF